MTHDDEFIGQVRSYLDEYEGLTPLPDVVHDAVRAQLPTTKQIGPVSGLMRDIYMNSTMDRPARWGLVAAVVIGAVVIGGAIFLGNGGVGNQPVTPSPSAAASNAATSEPTASGPTDFGTVPKLAALEPGDYAFTTIPGIEVVFTVGPEWEKGFPDWVIWTTEDDKGTLGAMTLDNLYVDPCQPDLGLLDPEVGPTVDDLVTALGAVPGLTLSAPTNVTQDGHAGVRLDHVPPDEFGCPPDSDILLGSVNGGSDDLAAPTGDDAVSYFVYEIGGTRVVLAAGYTAERADDLDAVIESIRFE